MHVSIPAELLTKGSRCAIGIYALAICGGARVDKDIALIMRFVPYSAPVILRSITWLLQNEYMIEYSEQDYDHVRTFLHITLKGSEV